MALDNSEFGDLMVNAHMGPFGTFGVRRALRRLVELLFDDEEVLAVTRGRVDATTWVMAVTDKRVLLVNKGLIYGYRHLEVPLDRVKSASSRTGAISGAIFIDTGGGTVVLEGIAKRSTAEVAGIISQAINSQPPKTGRVRPAQASLAKPPALAAKAPTSAAKPPASAAKPPAPGAQPPAKAS